MNSFEEEVKKIRRKRIALGALNVAFPVLSVKLWPISLYLALRGLGYLNSARGVKELIEYRRKVTEVLKKGYAEEDGQITLLTFFPCDKNVRGGFVTEAFEILSKCKDVKVVCKGNRKEGNLIGLKEVEKFSKDSISYLTRGPLRALLRRFPELGFALALRKLVRSVEKSLGGFVVPIVIRDVAFVALGTLTTKNGVVRFSTYMMNRDKLTTRERILREFVETLLSLMPKKRLLCSSSRDALRLLQGERWVSFSDVSWIYLGIPDSVAERAKRVQKKFDGRVKFYHFSIFHPLRQYEELLESAFSLTKEFDDVEFNIYIAFPDFVRRIEKERQERIREYLREAPKRVNVTLLDRTLSIEEVLRIHEEGHVLVWPEKRSAWGLTPLEALAFGNAVVVSEESGVSELLKQFNMKGIFFYNPNVKGSLYSVLKKVARDRSWQNNWEERRNVFLEFTYKKTCELLSLAKAYWKGKRKTYKHS